MEWCLDLLLDPIPNVRMHACSLLPALKRTIRLPEDVEQLVRTTRLSSCNSLSLLSSITAA